MATLVRRSLYNAAAGMTMLLTGFASSIITARLLGPEANGTVAFAFWLTTTGTLVAGLGSDVLLPRMLPQLKANGFDERRRRGFVAFIAQFVALAVLAALAVFWFVNHETEDTAWALGTSPVVAVTGVLFLLQSIGTLTVNTLIGEQQPMIFFRLTIVASVLQLIATIIGALWYGEAGALGGYLASYIVFFLYALRLVLVRPDRCGSSLGDLARASAFISMGTIIESIFLNRVELAFLQHFQGIHSVGFYAIGLTLSNLALQLPVQLSGTLVPYYTELAHKRGSTRLPVHLFEDVIRVLAYMTLPMGFGLAAISTEVVQDIFGPDFAAAGSVVALLAISAPLSVFAQISTKYLFAIGQEQPRMIIGVIGALIISLGCLAAVPYLGDEGAALVRILMLLTISILMVLRMDFEGSLRGMVVSLVKIGTASLACAGVAYAVTTSIDGLIGAACAIVCGAIVYVLALKILHAVPEQDALSVMRLSDRLPGNWALLARRFAVFMSGKPNDDHAPSHAE